jgi:hypothetical protein
LRASVRRELGLIDNDMLVISLSSINPGKGQLLFLESANSVVENESFQDDYKMQNSSKVEDIYTLSRRHHLRKLLPMMKDSNISSNTISRQHESNNNIHGCRAICRNLPRQTLH